MVRECVWCGVVLGWVLLYCCCFFSLFVSFLVRGSGLSTSLYVTSLYIDAALLGGPDIFQCECGLLDYKKKKKKNKTLPKLAYTHTTNKPSRLQRSRTKTI